MPLDNLCKPAQAFSFLLIRLARMAPGGMAEADWHITLAREENCGQAFSDRQPSVDRQILLTGA